jgi:hypothetical protein
MSAGSDPEEREHDDVEDVGLDIDVLRRRRERFLTLLALFFIVVVGIFVARAIFKPKPVDRLELIAAAKRAVRSAAPENTVLAFSTTSEFLIEVESPGRYSVRGEVLQMTPDGRSDHFFFVCTLMRAGGGAWRPVQLTVTPG